MQKIRNNKSNQLLNQYNICEKKANKKIKYDANYESKKFPFMCPFHSNHLALEMYLPYQFKQVSLNWSECIYA